MRVIGPVVTLVLLAVSSLVGTALVTGDRLPRSEAAEYVPADGFAEPAEALGRPVSVESQIIGEAAIGESVVQAQMERSRALGRTDRPNAVWRVTLGGTESLHTAEALFVVPEDGSVGLLGSAWNDAGLFEPALPVLPASMEETSWHANGHVSVNDGEPQPYLFQAESEQTDDACTTVAWTLTITDEQRGRARFCRDRGVVEGQLPFIPTLLPRTPSEPTEPPVPESTPPAQRPGDTPMVAVTPLGQNPAWGPVEGRLDPNAVGITLDDHVVSVTPDRTGLVAHDASHTPIGPSTESEPVWTAAPPGVIAGLLVQGRHVLVTTSTGDLIAYDQNGRRLWSVALPDVPLGGPQRLDDRRVVVATVSGPIVAHDVADGALAWRARTAPATSLPRIITTGGHATAIIVATDSERIVLDADGEELGQESLDSADLRAAVGVPGGVVAISGNGLRLERLSEEGEVVDSRQTFLNDTARRLYLDPDHPEVVTAVTGAGLVAVDTRTLEPVAHLRGVDAATWVQGVGLVMLNREGLHLVSFDGSGFEIEQTWVGDVPDAASSLTVLARPGQPDRWWIITTGDEKGVVAL